MGKIIDPGDTQVAWFPEERAYRIVRHKVETVSVGDEKQSFEIAVPGALVTWVDDAPNDPADGSGHFEQHSGSKDSYVATRREPEED